MYDKLTAYEGRENYIFISYSHRDTEKVMPIMEKLRDLGCRIWYDEGIAPGSEWPEDIAQHLNSCAMVIAFISANSMASVNCRREINFALSKQKPFLSVVLEPTDMPLGMELQLSAQQSVLRYNFRTEEQFIDKICSCPDLASCKEDRKHPEPVAVVQPIPDVAPAPAPAETPVTMKTEPEKARKPKKNNKFLGIAACALILVVAVVVCMFALPGNSAAENSAANNETSVSQTQPAQTDTAEAEEQLVVHVKLPKTWTSASLRAWSDSTGKEAFDEKSGQLLQKDADGWYIGMVPSWVNRVSLVKEDETFETSHIVMGGKDIWVVVREDWTHQVSDQGPFVATIKVRASLDKWKDLHCWAWTADGDVFEAWPGQALTETGRWYTIDIPCNTIGVKFSDQETGDETKDIILEPGWDIWLYERAGYYMWDYTELPEDELKEIFRSVGIEY